MNSQKIITLGLDKPSEECSKGNYQVAGWAISTAPILNVEVVLDGQNIGYAILGQFRPDVAKLFPVENADRSGFFMSLPWTMEKGSHTLEITAVDALGRKATLIRNFEVDGKLVESLKTWKPKWWDRMALMDSSDVGVNVAGYFHSEKGMGEAVRSDVRSLEAAGIPCVLNDLHEPGSVNHGAYVGHHKFSVTNPYTINLIHVNADRVYDFMEERGPTYLRGRYNIGYWTWELSDFPKEYRNSFSPFDEIWVPSNFVLDSISRISPVPVLRIPHNFDPIPICGKLTRQDLGLKEIDFLFSYLFDFHSVFARKNPLGLVRAFKQAFSPSESAGLVIKCSHSESVQSSLKQLLQESQGHNIRIIDAVWPRDLVWAFMSLTDCYVSLHRSEGFGLTLLEAMSLAKPVIATGYSGNMDFMNHMNSYLVKYDLVELDQDYGPYKQGSYWAEPDINDSARLMRYVFEHRDEARDVGQKAAQDVRRHFGPEATGRLYASRIKTILKYLSNY